MNFLQKSSGGTQAVHASDRRSDFGRDKMTAYKNGIYTAAARCLYTRTA